VLPHPSHAGKADVKLLHEIFGIRILPVGQLQSPFTQPGMAQEISAEGSAIAAEDTSTPILLYHDES
jgi:hypothetical protein